MASKKKSHRKSQHKSHKKSTKHVPLSVLRKRYNRHVRGNAALAKLIERRAAHPTDPNDRR